MSQTSSGQQLMVSALQQQMLGVWATTRVTRTTKMLRIMAIGTRNWLLAGIRKGRFTRDDLLVPSPAHWLVSLITPQRSLRAKECALIAFVTRGPSTRFEKDSGCGGFSCWVPEILIMREDDDREKEISLMATTTLVMEVSATDARHASLYSSGRDRSSQALCNSQQGEL